MANEAQARDAVSRWDQSVRSEWYAIELDVKMDDRQVATVKDVLDDLDTQRLFWLFHNEWSN